MNGTIVMITSRYYVHNVMVEKEIKSLSLSK
mgnify:CR=1 FL=1